MKLRSAGVGASLVIALLLPGCGAETPAAQTVTATATTTVSAMVTADPPAPVTVTATVTPQLSVPPAPAAGEVAAWGEPQAVSDGIATVTVYGVEIPADITGPEPSQGLSWAAVDAELCMSAQSPGAQVSWSPWGLTAGSKNYDAVSMTYNQFPKPSYPVVDPVGPGECARGWIVFEAPNDGSVTQVRYANPDLSGTSVEIIKWNVAG